MNKHQTLVYIKYGKLINEINDEITVPDIKSDMIKFLNIISGTLIYPNSIYQHYGDKHGVFRFIITKPSNIIKFVFINFDGNNNFKIWPLWPFNNNTWASIDDIDHYVELYPNDFKNILRIK